ncbi:MAG: 3-alpha,7-alpha,12-alpha-trihydroxy-5-beta-cholest-24-enoyl-CoA hydratase [Rhodobacteraceae bacterium]|nr:3-alpha,7-alpha,12-alpha-trihydroxy-5-beta-cholest-24-enoyl-CoA hydratase [Paracoccaceae bacterium]
MPLDRDRLLALDDHVATRRLAEDGTILYALAVGMGGDPAELGFVYERDLRAVPSMATVVGFHDGWLGRAGIALGDVYHVAQGLVLERPLPVAGPVEVRNRVVGGLDKGEGRPALLFQETVIAPADGGAPFATGLSTLFVRGGGGFGGDFGRPAPAARAAPAGPPALTASVRTRPDQALLFRLLGDRNPLHVDPAAAAAAGQPAPILHGACTFGIACGIVLRAVCGLDPARLAAIEARFVAPVFPGERLDCGLWPAGDTVAFRLTAPERGVTILDAGHAALRPAGGA